MKIPIFYFIVKKINTTEKKATPQLINAIFNGHIAICAQN